MLKKNATIDARLYNALEKDKILQVKRVMFITEGLLTSFLDFHGSKEKIDEKNKKLFFMKIDQILAKLDPILIEHLSHIQKKLILSPQTSYLKRVYSIVS